MEHPNQVGDWIQISVLGSGSFGTVSLWRNQATAESIAVKKCKFLTANALSPKQKERWRMEVAFLQSISHPNVIACQALDPGLERALSRCNPTGLPLMPMEYCTKGNLRHFMGSEPIRMCGLPEQDVRDILQDVSSGLSHLHAHNITHRDIKPDNVVLQHCAHRPSHTLYKIIDLGYAKELNDATLSFVGTLHYLAPEIFRGRDYDRRVDYWSMGVMAAELVSGVLPFLPEATPFERFERIADKGPDDICIYTSCAGAVSSSSELRREHFLSGCLKQGLEGWLRRALQFDPANRRFRGGLSAFEFLRFILDKQIVQVFSLHKAEFYSYEVNDCTRLDTLKAWVARDIKVPVGDLLFLDSHGVLQGAQQGDALLGGPLSRPGLLLFAFKGAELVAGGPPIAKAPALVKDLFISQVKFSRPLYRQALFLVRSVLEGQRALEGALGALLLHLDARIQALAAGYREAVARQAERHRARLAEVGAQCRRLMGMRAGLGAAEAEVRSILRAHNVQALFDDLNSKGFIERAQQDVVKRLRGVVSDTLKLQGRLHQHERLARYSQEFGALLRWTEQLSSWLRSFMAGLSPAMKPQPPPLQAIIEENLQLQTQLTELLSSATARHLDIWH